MPPTPIFYGGTTPGVLDRSAFQSCDLDMPPTDGDVLTFDAASGLWKNKPSAGGGGGGGGSVIVGTRAALPSAASNPNVIYRCTDAPYEYFSDGSIWYANVFGYQGIDPGADSTVVLKHTIAPSGSTSDTSAGGIKFNVGSHSGDHLEAYVKPVTGSTTLAVAIGFNQSGSATPQGGPVVYSAGSGKWTFFRFAAGALFASQYLDGTGWVSNLASKTWINPWPRRGVWGLTFAAGAKLDFYSDSDLYVPTSDLGGGYTDSYVGSTVTHIGVGGNLAQSDIWFQFMKILRT